MAENEHTHFDVLVVGGGAGGIAAAVGASQAGAKTLLIESGPCLGGAATQKNVCGYCGLYTAADKPKTAVGGVARQVFSELHTLHGVDAPVRVGEFTAALVDPEAVKIALDRVVTNAGVHVLMHTSLIQATRTGGRIESVTLQDHRGARQYTASMFIDASGEGDLAAFGGAAVPYGDHGETQAGTLAVRLGGVKSDASTEPSAWAGAIRKAKSSGAQLLDKEECTLFRLPISGDIVSYMIDASYNALSGSSITNAEVQGRERAWAYLDAIRTVPGYEQAYIVSSGPNFGTRQSRRITGKYQVTKEDLTTGARHTDVIALGAWPSEYHPGGSKPVVWEHIKDKGTFDIPLRALMSVDTANLYCAGRLVDGDKSAGAAMRVMGTSFATGHAAGVAAALHMRGSADVQAVQFELERQHALIRADELT